MTEPCPHCGARSGMVPDPPTGHRCALCGGPRILVEPAVPRGGGEKALLSEVKRVRGKRAAWGVGAGIATALAMLMGVVAVITGSVFDLQALGWTLLTIMALAPALLAGYGFRRASALTTDANAKLAEAEEVVAAEIIGARGSIDASELARMMQISEERAYELLAHAEIIGTLSVREPPPPAARVRVDDSTYREDEVDPTADTIEMRQRRS